MSDCNSSGIYRIINVNSNKQYVGSSINIKTRWREHIKGLKNNKHHSISLQRAWNKYGEHSFRFEVIENCEIESLISREQYFLDTINPEYNICKTAGSLLGTKRTEEQKINISKSHIGQQAWNKGLEMSDEFKLKCSESKQGNIPWNKGKQLDEEYKKKLSLSHIGKQTYSSHPQALRVLQFDKSGNFIAEFDCIKRAAEETGSNRRSISQVCKGQRKTTNNYIFKYESEVS